MKHCTLRKKLPLVNLCWYTVLNLRSPKDRPHHTDTTTIPHYILGIERTDCCCSETESVTAQICSGRNRTEPHTQIRASSCGQPMPQTAVAASRSPARRQLTQLRSFDAAEFRVTSHNGRTRCRIVLCVLCPL